MKYQILGYTVTNYITKEKMSCGMKPAWAPATNLQSYRTRKPS